MNEARLEDVFGIRVQVDTRYYINRGNLDERLNTLLKSDRHVIIHGDSKQGKSWLRSRLLNVDDTVLVQCQPGTTAEKIVIEALGSLGVMAAIKRKTGGNFEGSLEISADLSVGAKILAKLGVKARSTVKGGRSKEIESEPVGRTPGDLSWVARVLSASDKRLVIEDFHYVSEAVRRDMAYLIKTLGDYGVFVIIVGVWPHDHMLSYYNGDLEGRIEDIHLQWNENELDHVLRVGAEHLGVAFSPGVRSQLIQDAYANVGLLQRLAESYCRAENVLAYRTDFPFLTDGPGLMTGRAIVADSMRGRFEGFADSFVLGLRRLPQGLEVYRHLLKVATEATDDDLQSGLHRSVLLGRVNQSSPAQIRAADLTQALQRIDALQAKINVKPTILTYSRESTRLTVVDKSFLFFRKYGNPNWPWIDASFTISNDLAATNPLDVTQ